MALSRLLSALAVAAALLSPAGPGRAAPLVEPAAAGPGTLQTFSTGELVQSGHSFFGNVSRGLALTVEEAVRRFGEPNAYILGQEASGALIGGVTYGEGTVYTKRGRGQRVYWQGPSIGFDVGGDGSRNMMLVYNLRSVPALYRRFLEVEGSAFVFAGFGVTAARADDTVIVPIRSGVGLRLGVSLGYLKFTDAPTWNPF
jgi:hypothetical protein